MASFEKGNKAWQARTSSFGRRPAFADPQELWVAACEYFEWAAENPLIEYKPFAFQGAITIAEVPKMRAMTIIGLCLFLDIGRTCFDNYRKRPEFKEVCEKIEAIIMTQKVEAASADLMNPNFIARLMGLREGVDVSSKDGTMTPVSKVTIEVIGGTENNGD